MPPRAAKVPAVLPVHVLAVPQTQFTIRVPDIRVVCRAGYVVVTVDTCPASALGCFWTFFSTCLWYSAPEVDSVLLSRVGTALVVDLGYGMCLLVLLVTVHLALCSVRFCWPENTTALVVSAHFAVCSPEVAGPQARVLRRKVEPIIESFVPVPMIDVPVPQMVDQLSEVVKFFVTLPVVAEQVVEVPTITLEDTIPQAAGGPDLVTHLGLYGANLLVAPGLRPRPVEHPEGITASPGRKTSTGQG